MTFHPSLLCSLFAAAVGFSPIAHAADLRPPNIIFILADDMGCGDVSAYNPAAAWQTPGIDRLAKGGMRFTDAHSSSAVCTPSRYSILTGRYSWRGARKSGVGGGLSPALIEPERMTVPALLREHGYATAMIGKWHLGLNWAKVDNAPLRSTDEPSDGEVRGAPPNERNAGVDFAKPFTGGPTACGFDSFFGISSSLDMPPYAWLRDDRVDAALPLKPIKGSSGLAMWRAGLAASDFAHVDALPRETDEAERYLRAQDGTKPFFLYLALTAPHTPIVPTTEFADRTHTTPYGDFCAQVDAAVGRVLAALAARGLEETTIVFFAADNGCSPSANFAGLAKFHHDPQIGFRGAKADIYEGGHRVPFVVRWPGHIAPDSTSREVVCLGDLLATCAALVDTKLADSAGEDSVSLLPALRGEKSSAPLHEALVHHSINGSFAIRQGPWKLCLCPDSGGWSAPLPGKAPADSPPFQLFNLEQDPGEKTNLYSAQPEIAERLGRLLKSYVLNGRSTPGARQENAGGSDWPELSWIKQFK